MDGWERLAGSPGVQVALPPAERYAGADGSGRVRVEIDAAARDAVVVLEPGWRSAAGAAGLGAAVLHAFAAATSARLTDWATAPVARVAPPSPSHGDRPTAETVSRAWRELREYRRQLTALHTATESVSSPGRRVVVTVAAGRLAGIQIDAVWQRTAIPPELERHIGHALRGALALIAGLPQRALDDYPALRALLSDAPSTPRSTEGTP
jgi:hypothetical protein